MAQLKFTQANVAKIKPPKHGQDQYYDKTNLPKGRTLALYVSYGGSKTWRVLYYVGGKPRSKGIGTCPDMSVEQARVAANEFKPGAITTGSEAGTFKAVAEAWVKGYVQKKKLRSEEPIKWQLKKYVYPQWAARPIGDIKRSDVNKLLDHVEHNHGVVMCDLVLATIRGVMEWYAAQGGDDDYNSPIVKKMNRDKRPSSERHRKRTLDDGEIRALWKAAGEMNSYGNLLKLLLLTGQRRDKTVTMHWNDVADGIWTIRQEDTQEKGNGGCLKLPQLALDILQSQPIIHGNHFVFPAGYRTKRHLNSFSNCKDVIDAKLPKGMPPWVVHDLRRTARSLMARAKVPDEHAERVLGHAIEGTEGIYNRFEYFDEKAEALDKLATLVESIVKL